MTNRGHNKHSQLRTFFAGWVMIGIFVLGLLASLIALPRIEHDALPDISAKTITNGQLTKEIDTQLQKKIPWRDVALGSWGIVSQAYFHSGFRGIFIGKNGWIFHRSEFEAVPDITYQEALKLYWIRQVQAFLAKHNVGLVMVIVPSKLRLYHHVLDVAWPMDRQTVYPRFTESLELLNIPVVMAVEPLEELKASGVNAFYKMDTHWSLEGARAVAFETAYLAKKACPGLSYPSIRYGVEELPKTSHYGDLMKFLPMEKLQRFIKKPQTQIPSFALIPPGNSLFDDPETPIALVGTSFSAIEHFQFADSLRLAFQTEIINFAEDAHGPFEPMVRFLNETDWDHHHYQLVIWEMPERHIHRYYETDWPEGVLEATSPTIPPCPATSFWGEE